MLDLFILQLVLTPLFKKNWNEIVVLFLSFQVQDCPTNRMLQTAKAHNDYFNAQFILLFPVPGIHLVTVEASVIDKEGDIWNTGPKTSVLIKSYSNDAVQKQVQFATRTLPQMSRSATGTSGQKLDQIPSNGSGEDSWRLLVVLCKRQNFEIFNFVYF